jgi:2'-hydroxyisoflavone reductase
MRLLILGGTVFLGRHVAAEALARGHQLTLYTRGLHGADLFPEAEHVHGDRADLAPLRGRGWDAVIDTSGYEPAIVAASASLDAGHYVFVSSISAYRDWPERPVTEDSPVYDAGDDYGALKAACERAAAAARPGRVANVRAGLIVGPHDSVFRLPWWVRRIAAGGIVPAPGDPRRRVQLIDARDLAAWLLDLAEGGVSGTFNGTAPPGQTTMGEVLEAAVRETARDAAGVRTSDGSLETAGDATGARARLRWIPDAALEAAGVEGWTELPLWLPAAFAGTWEAGTDRSQAAGLRCRPVAATVADVASWLRAGGEAELTDWNAATRPAPMSAEREAELLALS